MFYTSYYVPIQIGTVYLGNKAMIEMCSLSHNRVDDPNLLNICSRGNLKIINQVLRVGVDRNLINILG